MKVFRKKNAFISLISVLVISIAGTAIALTLLWLSTGSTKSRIAITGSSQAGELANLCAEVALNNLKRNINYSGNETISVTEGSCQILSVLGSGNNNRTIQTSGTVGTYIRKVEVQIQEVSPQIQLTSWQEVADF